MKVLRTGISYNHACLILEANKYKITSTLTIKNHTIFFHGSTKVAAYNETNGTLSVINNKKENKNEYCNSSKSY